MIDGPSPVSDRTVKSVTILIATRNRWHLLRDCLQSLDQLVSRPGLALTLRVVDNGSTDGSYQALVEYASQPHRHPVEVISHPIAGKSRALNQGLAGMTSDVVLFTDDDMAFDPGWALAIADHFNNCTCSGLVGAIELSFPEGRPEWFTPTCSQLTGETAGLLPGYRPTELPGNNMAVRTETIRRIGLFREDLGPVGKRYAAGEDSEWSHRIVETGGTLCYCPTAVNYHGACRWITRSAVWWRQVYFCRREVERAIASGTGVRWSLLSEVRSLLGAVVFRRRVFQGFDHALELAQHWGRILGFLRAFAHCPPPPY